MKTYTKALALLVVSMQAFASEQDSKQAKNRNEIILCLPCDTGNIPNPGLVPLLKKITSTPIMERFEKIVKDRYVDEHPESGFIKNQQINNVSEQEDVVISLFAEKFFASAAWSKAQDFVKPYGAENLHVVFKNFPEYRDRKKYLLNHWIVKHMNQADIAPDVIANKLDAQCERFNRKNK